jgi:hypothetical protein
MTQPRWLLDSDFLVRPSAQEEKEEDAQSRIFSQGSSIEKTKVDSNQILRRQKNSLTLDFGRWSDGWTGETDMLWDHPTPL